MNGERSVSVSINLKKMSGGNSCGSTSAEASDGYTINSSCINCGACEEQCPVGAIRPGDHQFYISKDTCIDCGSCVGTCPANAIVKG